MSELYDVVQFFQDDSYEYVRCSVSAEEAVKAAYHYSHSIGAKLGTTRRVIITDDGDCTTFEWRYGEGVVFPTKAEGANFPDAKTSPPAEWSLEDNLKHGGGL